MNRLLVACRIFNLHTHTLSSHDKSYLFLFYRHKILFFISFTSTLVYSTRLRFETTIVANASLRLATCKEQQVVVQTWQKTKSNVHLSRLVVDASYQWFQWCWNLLVASSSAKRKSVKKIVFQLCIFCCRRRSLFYRSSISDFTSSHGTRASFYRLCNFLTIFMFWMWKRKSHSPQSKRMPKTDTETENGLCVFESIGEVVHKTNRNEIN